MPPRWLNQSFRRISAPTRSASAVAFFLLTAVLLSGPKLWAPIHLDTARDLLLARECLVGARCPFTGPHSSFGALWHGALWSHLLEAREWLGVSVAGFERMIDVLLALSAAIVIVSALPFSQGRGRLLTWALWFPAALLTIEYPLLWNPSPTPLALAVFYGLFLHGCRERSSWWLIGAAIPLTLAIDLHLINALLIPFFLFAVVACDRRPPVTITACTAAALAFFRISSRGAFSENIELARRYGVAVTAVLLASVVIGLALRSRMIAQEGIARSSRLLIWLCVWLSAPVILAAIVTGHPLSLRYFAPLAIPASLVAGSRWSARAAVGSEWPLPARRSALAALLIVVGYIGAFFIDRAWNIDFRLREAERIAAPLFGRGVSFPFLHRHLRGPSAFELLSALAPFEPLSAAPQETAATPRPDDDLLVMRARRDALPSPVPENLQIIDLDRTAVAIVTTYSPYVKVDEFEVCRARDETPLPRECMHVKFEGASLRGWRSPGWMARAYPSFDSIDRAFSDHRLGGMRVTYRFPLRLPAGAAPRWIAGLRDSDLRWRVDAATGATNPLPATCARVIPPAEGMEGEISISAIVPANAPYTYRSWLPSFAELGDDDAGRSFAAMLCTP